MRSLWFSYIRPLRGGPGEWGIVISAALVVLLIAREGVAGLPISQLRAPDGFGRQRPPSQTTSPANGRSPGVVVLPLNGAASTRLLGTPAGNPPRPVGASPRGGHAHADAERPESGGYGFCRSPPILAACGLLLLTGAGLRQSMQPRQAECALLKLFGYSPVYVGALHVAELVVQAMLGGFIGVLLAMSAPLLRHAAPDVPAAVPILWAPLLAPVAGLCFLLAAGAGLVRALRSASIRAADLLRPPDDACKPQSAGMPGR